MTLVSRIGRRQLTAAMALAMALALLLGSSALAQVPGAVEINDSCDGAPDPGFDDIAGTTFEDEIECLAWYEITQGVGGGDGYAPLDGVRRWQMALFIHRLAAFADEQLDDVDLPDASDQGFTDIDELSQEAQDAVNILAAADVVKGKTSTTYEPFEYIRRDQMASFINRLQEWMTGEGFPSAGDVFPDVGDDNVHRANINAIAEAGIVQGRSNGRYVPGGTVLRGQMAAFIVRHIEVNVDAGVLEPKGETSGEVSLDADQVEAGGSVSGSVSDPGTVDNIAVSGCGFSNESVELDGDGKFTLTVPSEQEPGSCELTFTVLRTDDSSTTTTIPFAVTAVPQTLTDSPDLVSASIDGDDDTVTYVFDEAANGSTPAAADFRIYDSGTGVDEAATVEILGSDPKQIVADFAGAAIDVEDATLASIRDDAVDDAAGNAAYASAVALNPQDLEAGRTSAPDLESVNNIRTDGGAIVADFRFDEEVEAYGAPPAAFPATPFGAASDFFLYTADGSAFPSTDIVGRSADNRTLTVEFGPAPVGFATSQVTRGVVTSTLATDVGDPINPTQTEPRTGAPDFTPGATADRTDEPDLVSVKVIGDDSVAFEFDEAVDTTPTFGSFFLYNSSGVETAGSTGVRSSTNANVVNVDFTPAAVSAAVGASVNAGAVNAVGDGEANLIHEMPLQDVSFSAGRTGFPDLVSVDISLDPFGDADVVYTFDADPPAGLVAADFALVDAQGTRFTPGADGDIDTGDDTVTFDSATAVFENSEAAAAVIGSVQDESAVAPPPIITEGDVTVSRDTSMTP